MKNINKVYVKFSLIKFSQIFLAFLFLILVFQLKLSLFSLALQVVIFIMSIVIISELLKWILPSYRFLKLNNKKLINDELDNVLYKNGFNILTDNYIVNIYNLEFIKNDDILLIYKKAKLMVRNGTGDFIHQIGIITKTKKYKLISNWLTDSKKPLDLSVSKNNLYEKIVEQMPNVLKGLTNENRKFLFEKYGIRTNYFIP